MAKSVFPNFEKWNVDERRLLVIFLLTLIYPVFVASFFALYLFVLMPVMVPIDFTLHQAHHEGWYHFYWLFFTMLWVVLCTFILPFFNKKKIPQMMDLGNVESSLLLHPPMIEVKKEGSQSNISQKSENSSDNIKKATSDLESEKESLGKSKESLSKSSASLDKKLSQSDDFLNDCMNTIDSEDKDKNETVCEIHAEEADNKIRNYSDQKDRELMDEGKDHQSGREDSDGKNRKDKDDSVTSDLKDGNTEEFLDKNKEENVKEYSDSSSEKSNSDAELEPLVSVQKAKDPQASSPLKVNEATVDQHKDTEESEMTEEVDQLDNDPTVLRQKRALPTIDTSRASQCYECSMPTPKIVERQSSQQNAVFLYINPDIGVDTEDSILVSQADEVEEIDVEETEIQKTN